MKAHETDKGDATFGFLLRQDGCGQQPDLTGARQRVRVVQPPAPPAAPPRGAPGRDDAGESPFAAMVTASAAMHAIFAYAKAIAGTARPVIVTGETGVGKELMARALHRLSGCTGDFLPLNVAGAEAALLSDLLFGRRKGGAGGCRQGLLARAAGGTLFLDEIGEMNLEAQVELLRLLEQQEHLGGMGQQHLPSPQARILLASSCDLQHSVKEGRFRSDLYYRISTHRIHIPPLRERKEDIPLLLDRFIGEAAQEFGVKAPIVPRQLLELLSNYHFPGNVRELKGMVHQAMANCRSFRVLSQETFRRIIAERQSRGLTAEVAADLDPRGELLEAVFGHFPTLHEAEDLLLQIALNRARGNQGIAATMLGLKRQTLNMRLKVKKDRRGG